MTKICFLFSLTGSKINRMLRQNKTLINKLIHLSTTDYASGFENPAISLLSAILPVPLTQVQSIKLLNFTLPYTYFNIDSTNNALNFMVGTNAFLSTAYTVTLDTGNYDIFTLLEALRLKMTTLNSNSWVLTCDQSTNRVTVTGALAFSILSTSSMATVLGITTSHNYITSCKFANGVNLLKATQILLHCNVVSSMSSSSNSDTILATVNIPSADFKFGDVINNASTFYSAYPVKFPNVSQLDFWWTNQLNQGLFLNNYDFTVDVELTYFE